MLEIVRNSCHPTLHTHTHTRRQVELWLVMEESLDGGSVEIGKIAGEEEEEEEEELKSTSSKMW